MAEGEMVGGITNSMDMNLSKFWETAEDRGAWHAVVHGVSKSLTQLSNCTTATNLLTKEAAWKRQNGSSREADRKCLQPL